MEGKNETVGSGKCFVRTNYSSSDAATNLNITSLTVNTQYPNAWNQTLHNLLAENVNYERGDTYVKISRKTKIINFYLDYYYIYVQIGRGWVEYLD